MLQSKLGLTRTFETSKMKLKESITKLQMMNLIIYRMGNGLS